jgi:hypothetical protein
VPVELTLPSSTLTEPNSTSFRVADCQAHYLPIARKLAVARERFGEGAVAPQSPSPHAYRRTVIHRGDIDWGVKADPIRLYSPLRLVSPLVGA